MVTMPDVIEKRISQKYGFKDTFELGDIVEQNKELIKTPCPRLARWQNVPGIGALHTILNSSQILKNRYRLDSLAALSALAEIVKKRTYEIRTDVHDDSDLEDLAHKYSVRTGVYSLIDQAALANLAISRKKGLRDGLRDTQIMAILANQLGYITDVKTGEGKTFIGVANAIISGLQGKKVDIFTTKEVLARRDWRENRDIFESVGITTGYVPTDGRILSDYQNKVTFEDIEALQKGDIDASQFLTTLNEMLEPETALVDPETGARYVGHLDLEKSLSADVTDLLSKGLKSAELKTRILKLLDKRIKALKQEAYKSDIIYTTIEDRVFDYEKDNTFALSTTHQVQTQRKRENCVAIVDEYDENMIDKGLNPKIITGSLEEAELKHSEFMKQMLVLMRYRIFTDEFRKGDGKYFDYSRVPKWIPFFGGLPIQTGQEEPINQAGSQYLAERLLGNHRYIIDEMCKHHKVKLKDDFDKGTFKQLLHYAIEQKSRLLERDSKFELSDSALASILAEGEISDLVDVFNDLSLAINLTHKADIEFKKGKQYDNEQQETFEDGKQKKRYIVTPIDQNTGSMSKGTKLSMGLHTALEIKEGVGFEGKEHEKGDPSKWKLNHLSPFDAPLAAITTYAWFKQWEEPSNWGNESRGYSQVMGMSGSNLPIEHIISDVFDAPVLEIPIFDHGNNNKAKATLEHAKETLENNTYKTRKEKLDAIVESAVQVAGTRPVIIRVEVDPEILGTEEEEFNYLVNKLTEEVQGKGITVYSLRHDREEQYQNVIDNAGKPNSITVTTDIAGRGADIKLKGQNPGEDPTHEMQAEGFRFILSSLHKDPRIDTQAVGRVARNGEYGEVIAFRSPEDELFHRFKESLKSDEEPGLLQKAALSFLGWLSTYKHMQGIHSQHKKNKELSTDYMWEYLYEDRQRLIEKTSVDDIVELFRDKNPIIYQLIGDKIDDLEAICDDDPERLKALIGYEINNGISAMLKESNKFDHNRDQHLSGRWLGLRRLLTYPSEHWGKIMSGIATAGAIGAAATNGAGFDASATAQSLAWTYAFFGGFGLFQYLRELGFEKQKPIGRIEEPTTSSSSDIALIDHAMKNAFIGYIPLAGIGLSVLSGTPLTEAVSAGVAAYTSGTLAYFLACREIFQGKLPFIGDQSAEVAERQNLASASVRGKLEQPQSPKLLEDFNRYITDPDSLEEDEHARTNVQRAYDKLLPALAGRNLVSREQLGDFLYQTARKYESTHPEAAIMAYAPLLNPQIEFSGDRNAVATEVETLCDSVLKSNPQEALQGLMALDQYYSGCNTTIRQKQIEAICRLSDYYSDRKKPQFAKIILERGKQQFPNSLEIISKLVKYI